MAKKQSPPAKKSDRRKFLRDLSLGAAAASTGLLAASCSEKSRKNTKDFDPEAQFNWRATTTWPPHFPVLGEGMDLFAEQVRIMSGGRLNIKVYGGGEIVPPFEMFDAVSLGAVQIGHGASYYWTGKIPASTFFCSVPFGMNAQQMNAWLIGGGGMKLWEDLYAEHNLVPFVCGNTGVQMGGWFNKEINTPDDLKGLKMRMPGIGGKVLAQAGASAVSIAGGEIYTGLERGVIDAAEWIGPYHDYKMGFHRVAKYYYYPGWHETGSTLEMIINKEAFESLPADLQEIVRSASYRANLWMLSEFEAKNNFYLKKMLTEDKVQLRKFPEEVMAALKKAADIVLAEMTENDPAAKKVYDAFSAFKKDVLEWNAVSERALAPYL